MNSYLRKNSKGLLTLSLLGLLGCSDSGTNLCTDSNNGNVHQEVNGEEVTDLSSVKGHDCLLSVSIENTRVTDLSPLAALPNLKVVSLGDNPLLEKVAPLASAPRLRGLTLYSGTRISDLRTLSQSPLLDLTLDRASSVDIHQVANLTRLERLSIRNIPFDTLAPLASLASLEKIYLIELPAKDNGFIVSLANLETYYCVESSLPTIEPLRNLTRLRHVTLLDCGVTDLEPLRGKSGISFLQVDEIIDPKGFELLPTLMGKGDTLLANTNTAYPDHVPPAVVQDLQAKGVNINPW